MRDWIVELRIWVDTIGLFIAPIPIIEFIIVALKSIIERRKKQADE